MRALLWIVVVLGNALSPTWMSESGTVTDVSEVQSRKAQYSMWVSELGSVTDVSDVQPWKALYPT